MLETIKQYHQEVFSELSASNLAFAYLDFKNNEFHSWELGGSGAIFDLASLTKPLTLGLYYADKKELSPEELLLLEHRAGLPSYGYLSALSWREQILSYPVKESDVLYSDYSFLRLMLEIEKNEQSSLKDLCQKYWNDIYFWKDLTQEQRESCAVTGNRAGKEIQGVVHDFNAHTINEFCSHAGLFSSIDGLASTAIDFNKEFSLLNWGSKRDSSGTRFSLGWDGVSDPESTLAGIGAPLDTFGFLGFTGTCWWMSPEKQRGWILLTNITKEHWHNRSLLNQIRRNTGKMVWEMDL